MPEHTRTRCRLGIKEERARCQIDDRCAGYAERTYVAARQTGRDGGTEVPLPDRFAGGCIQGVNIVGLGRDDDLGAIIRPPFYIERLRINVANDGAVERSVSGQSRGGAGGEGWINIQAVARGVIMMLGDIDRRRVRAGRESQAKDCTYCEDTPTHALVHLGILSQNRLGNNRVKAALALARLRTTEGIAQL